MTTYRDLSGNNRYGATINEGNEVFFGDGVTTSKTFTGIPGGKNKLVVYVSGRNTLSANANILFTVNNLATGYDFQRVGGTGASASAVEDLNAANIDQWGGLPGTAATANFTTVCELSIYNYDRTDVFKPLMGQSRLINSASTGSGYAFNTSGVIRTLLPITSVTISLSAGAFATGSIIRCMTQN